MSEKQILDVDMTGISDTPESKFPEKLKPGVYDFMITGMEIGDENKQKTPYMEMTVIANGLEHKDRFYLTSKSLPRLKHVMLAAGNSKESLDTKLNSEQIKKMMIGKSWHGILGGREFEKEGKVYIASEFGFSRFAELTGNNILTFNADKHIKRLEKNPHTSSEDYMVAPATGDLPF